MFGPNSVGGVLTFTRVLGGISKALGIANQAIPIYKEIKPMIGNARKIMGVLKEFNTLDNSKTAPVKKTIDVEDKANKKEDIVQNTISSTPVFFQ